MSERIQGGAHDPRCPISQVYEAQEVMQRLGKPFETVIYPDEGHGFLKIENQVDAERRWAEFYRLEEGRYRLTHAGAEGVVRSHAIPDFWLRVEWLWQQPLPPIFDLLRELGVTA